MSCNVRGVDEGFEVNYGIRANNPAIERVIRAFDAISEIAFNSPPSAAQVTAINDAVGLLTQALDTPPVGETTIGGLFAQTQLQRAIFDGIKTKHENFAAFAEKYIAEIEQVNIAEAISIFNSEQITLEASFASIARIQSISLVNFIT